jgi:hypothetical protein
MKIASTIRKIKRFIEERKGKRNMLIDGTHVNAFPRQDKGPKPLKPENMIGKLEFNKYSETYKLEIFDKDNPEFKLTIYLSHDEINEVKVNS